MYIWSKLLQPYASSDILHLCDTIFPSTPEVVEHIAQPLHLNFFNLFFFKQPLNLMLHL